MFRKTCFHASNLITPSPLFSIRFVRCENVDNCEHSLKRHFFSESPVSAVVSRSKSFRLSIGRSRGGIRSSKTILSNRFNRLALVVSIIPLLFNLVGRIGYLTKNWAKRRYALAAWLLEIYREKSSFRCHNNYKALMCMRHKHSAISIRTSSSECETEHLPLPTCKNSDFPSCPHFTIFIETNLGECSFRKSKM